MTAPLADITVLDLTHVLAGPYCAMTLADLGAKVIKVEPPGGDDTRAFPPFLGDQSAYFATINRGKHAIMLDLKAQTDRTIFDALLARADILLENYRPGVMDRLGYGWDTVHKRHPRLIYGAVSGFGHTGPDAHEPAYDMVVQARGGVMSMTGERGRDPVRVGASVGDIVAGMNLTSGVLAALHARARDGAGRKIDVSMLDSQLAILEHGIAITHATGHAPEPNGARHPSIAPFETYRASDGLFVIAAGNDKLFAALSATLDLGLTDDAKFATNAARCQNAPLLKRLIEAVTLGRPRAEWIEQLRTAGVPTAAIQTVAEAMTDPQLVARDMVVDVLDSDGNATFRAAGNPIKMTGLQTPQARTAPAIDHDRSAILNWIAETDPKC
ncbi:MAG: CoA transferase [Pseudomonadota bacterium]